jgi:N-acetylglucosamine kinase-like BadF-type ATPase
VNGLKCVIGIDGGGTKTLLRITDLEGRVLTEQTGGLSNICASDRKTVEDNLRDLLNRSLKELPSNREIAAVCIGSAGVVAKENVLFFKEFLKEMTECGNVIVYTDAYVALFANLESKPGVSVTAGTGSICCGKNRQGVFYTFPQVQQREGLKNPSLSYVQRIIFVLFPKRLRPSVLLLRLPLLG